MERADFISRGSTLFTPFIVLSSMGHCVPQKITAILDISPIPKNRRNTGKRERDDTCLNAWTRPSEVSSKPLYQPIRNPRGIIVITARLNPANERQRLMLICIHSSPDADNLKSAIRTSDGGERKVRLIMPSAGSNSQVNRKMIRARVLLMCLYTIFCLLSNKPSCFLPEPQEI